MSVSWTKGCSKCGFLIVHKMTCLGRAKYSGLCSARFLFFLWRKWCRFSSGCTFSHFSRPSIMHWQIKIVGTLENQLEWVCVLCTHTHTHRHFAAHTKKRTSPPLHAPTTHNQMSLPQSDEHWHHHICSTQSTEWHFPPVPCCSELPGKEEAPPGSALLGQAGWLAKAKMEVIM